jgi:acyl-CoA synthetase (NDP forming)
MNSAGLSTDMPGLRARRRANLKRLLKPRTIAFIGGRHLKRCIGTTRDGGYDGEIIVVNPRYERLADFACVPSLDALEAAPDAAFIALSRENSIKTVAALAAMGAGGAVCHAAGFAELGGEHRRAQEKLAQAAGDLAVIGPNCMGIVNAFERASLWAEYNPLPPVEGPGIALFSQSGAFLYGVVGVERAYPMGYGVSVGNQAVIDTADLIDVTLDDPRVRVIGIYAEGLSHGPALADALCKAMERRVPIVLLRGGGTEAAAERSLSHTGNMAVPNDFWQALIDRYCLIQVASPKQLVETTKLLAVAGVPDGNRIFVATYSGAAGTLLAEQAPQRGLVLPPVTREGYDKVRPTLPEVVTVSNPLDLNLPWRSETGVSMDDPDSLVRCLIDASDGGADALVFMLDVPRKETGGDTPWLATIEALTMLRERTGAPVVASGLFPEGLEVHLRTQLLEGGVAPMMGFAETLDALGHAAAYRRAVDSRREVPAPLLPTRAPRKPVAWDEGAGKRLLADAGLPVPQGWTGPADDAPATAVEIGFPVALKLLSSTLLHKNRVGGVRLGLGSVGAVKDALKEMRRDVERAAPGHGVAQVLVEAMVEEPVGEVLVGLKRHPALGLALVLGAGGIAVENLRHFALVLLPASAQEIGAALDRLALAPAPDARRNLMHVIDVVQRFAVSHADRIAELDINPVILGKDGSATAADVLLVMERATQGADP